MAKVDVLIPTRNRSEALTATLTSLYFQSFSDFRVIISDQSDNFIASETIKTIFRMYSANKEKVTLLHNLPRKGIAQQRQFLLNTTTAEYCLFLDDDLILEPYVLTNMFKAITEEKCGFVGMAPIGLSFKKDIRPKEQSVEFWSCGVKPEAVTPVSKKWQRHKLHNAANIYHVAKKFKLKPENQQKYKIAWVGGCVLYDTSKLKVCGGYSFWDKVPKVTCGEDVLAQLRVMKKFGGCGLLPSGAYHQELPTTLINRKHDAPFLLGI
ncbi:MAG: glycosyltransferase family 2 protein [Patescibacteria group bacterium]|jgi:glycosyltransferase involved in cell wall biosynthesis